MALCHIVFSHDSLILTRLLLLTWLFPTTTHCLATQVCNSDVRTLYAAITGGDTDGVPERMITGQHLHVCTSTASCCTAEMETKLMKRTSTDFDMLLGSKLSRSKQTFITSTAKFDALFIDTLNSSRNELQTNLQRVYTDTSNTRMFADLFTDLKSYYKGDDINLIDTIDRFFFKLSLDLFEQHATASGRSFRPDQGYMSCFDDQLDRLRPFESIQQTLLRLVRRSFVSARHLANGLRVGRNTLISVSKLQPGESCVSTMMRMLYCPLCRGLIPAHDDLPWLAQQLKPCGWYCSNVMSSCLTRYTDLNTVWNDYMVYTIAGLSADLDNRRRLEAARSLEKIGLYLLAINTRLQVEVTCGRPSSRDPRRANHDVGRFVQSPDGAALRLNRNSNVNLRVPTPQTSGTALEKLVREFRGRLEATRDVWLRLPELICHDLDAPMTSKSSSATERCWNGRTLELTSSYNHQHSPDATHASDGPVRIDAHKANIINEWKSQLIRATNELRDAYNDTDTIKGTPFDEDFDSESGSGYLMGSNRKTTHVNYGIVTSSATRSFNWSSVTAVLLLVVWVELVFGTTKQLPGA